MFGTVSSRCSDTGYCQCVCGTEPPSSAGMRGCADARDATSRVWERLLATESYCSRAHPRCIYAYECLVRIRIIARYRYRYPHPARPPRRRALQNLCSASGSACCRLAINTMKLLLLTLLLSLAVDSANSCKSDLDCAHVTSPRPSHSRSANHDCAVGLRVSIHRRPWQADPLAMARARVHRLAERGL